MTILFSMRNPGALRNFASTVEELARRGHQIHLTFLMRDKLAVPRLLETLTGTYPAVTHDWAHVSRRAWLGMARATRSTADYLRYCAPAYREAMALTERSIVGQRIELGKFLGIVKEGIADRVSDCRRQAGIALL